MRYAALVPIIVLALFAGCQADATDEILPPQPPAPPATPGDANIAGQAYLSAADLESRADFAPPWDILNNEELLLRTFPETPEGPDGVELIVDHSGNDVQLTYENGWIWQDGQWELLSLEGTPSDFTGFHKGSIQSLIPAELLSEGDNYVVAYACTAVIQNQGQATYGCGCKSETDCGYWQLQRITIGAPTGPGEQPGDPEVVCGDGTCEGDESAQTCPSDCTDTEGEPDPDDWMMALGVAVREPYAPGEIDVSIANMQEGYTATINSGGESFEATPSDPGYTVRDLDPGVYSFSAQMRYPNGTTLSASIPATIKSFTTTGSVQLSMDQFTQSEPGHPVLGQFRIPGFQDEMVGFSSDRLLYRVLPGGETTPLDSTLAGDAAINGERLLYPASGHVFTEGGTYEVRVWSSARPDAFRKKTEVTIPTVDKNPYYLMIVTDNTGEAPFETQIAPVKVRDLPGGQRLKYFRGTSTFENQGGYFVTFPRDGEYYPNVFVGSELVQQERILVGERPAGFERIEVYEGRASGDRWIELALDDPNAEFRIVTPESQGDWVPYKPYNGYHLLSSYLDGDHTFEVRSGGQTYDWTFGGKLRYPDMEYTSDGSLDLYHIDTKTEDGVTTFRLGLRRPFIWQFRIDFGDGNVTEWTDGWDYRDPDTSSYNDYVLYIPHEYAESGTYTVTVAGRNRGSTDPKFERTFTVNV